MKINTIISKGIAYAVVFSFIASNTAYTVCENSWTLRSRASADTTTSRDIEGRFSSDAIQDGEDGFTFAIWDKNPNILASGTYANLKSVSGELTDVETKTLNSMLKRIKKRLLEERFVSEEDGDIKKAFFNKEDFDIKVRVIYPAYKSATYDRRTDTITFDRRSFDNEDFLYFTIKHELTDRKLPSVNIIGRQFKESPGLRELFTLITVNIAGFINLRKEDIQRAESMLDYYRSIANPNNGLLGCYVRIVHDLSIKDPFSFTEDIFKLVESEENKVYFPNMREAVRELAVKKGDDSVDYELTGAALGAWLRSIEKKFFEIQHATGKPQLMPLGDFKGKIPESLKPFMPYAEHIDYELEGDCVFLRIKLNNSRGNARFTYLYIGLNDNWDSVLGKRGKIYGLTYHKWQEKSTGVFQYRHDGTEKDRRVYWGDLIRLPITKLIKEMYDDSNQAKLKELFLNLFNELGIKDNLSKKTWLSIIKDIVGRKKAPGRYYVIRNIIWEHINRVYPKLFLREYNLQDVSLADIPAWLVMEDPNMNLEVLSWLNPHKKHGPLSFYKHAERVSMRDILRMLQETDSQSIDFHAMPKTLEVYTIQQTQSAVYVAA